jgi:hypothetical protein
MEEGDNRRKGVLHGFCLPASATAAIFIIAATGRAKHDALDAAPISQEDVLRRETSRQAKTYSVSCTLSM